MSKTPSKKSASDDAGAVVAPEPGPVSQWLNKQGFDHNSLEPDHLGVEQISVDAAVLPMIAAALKSNGFDYLQCQGGYDEAVSNWFASITCWRWRNRWRPWWPIPQPSCGK